MKQTKTFFALLCGLLLFSALSFGANGNSGIQGRWTSRNPMLRHGNMLPVTELNFTGQGNLFIEKKNGSEGIVSLYASYAYFYDGKELILRNRYDNQLFQYSRGTASIEEREVLPKALTVQGFDEDVLPSGTYWHLGEN